MTNMKVCLLVNFNSPIDNQLLANNCFQLPICFYFKEILEYIKQECSKHGAVKSVQIPRPMPGVAVAGVGKVRVLSFS